MTEKSQEMDADPAWEPSEELVQWAVGFFQEFPENMHWKPADTGLTYRKMCFEKSWLLVRMIDTDEARESHERIKSSMSEAGVTMVDEDYNLVSAQGLEDVWPEHIGDWEEEMRDGSTGSVEYWAYKTRDTGSGELVNVDPEDYWMLMGDVFYMRFETDGVRYFAMDRAEMAESVDRNEVGSGLAAVVGTRVGNERVPPWMWATYCRVEGGFCSPSSAFDDWETPQPGIEVV